MSTVIVYELLSVAIVFFTLLSQSECVLNKEKVIDDTPMTIRVVAGSTALLPCSVDPRYTEQYADQYKVLWVKPNHTLISIQDRRILNDMRMSVERPFLKDWNLHIRNVSLTDAGIYKCQINTDPVETKKINLVVQEPPRIIGHSVPSDIERPEGETVELFCNATGTPPPDISWYRLHKKGNAIRERVGHTGDSLVIHNITRMCGDYYECVADNNVPPAVSQTFKISVQYPPEVLLPNVRLGQQEGKDTILECEVSASPLGNAVWKHSGSKLVNSPTHELTLYSNNLDDSVILSLRILKIRSQDFGVYVCEASNLLGTTSKSMELYELASKTPSTTTTSTTTPKHVWIYKGPNQEVLDVDNSARFLNRNKQTNQELVRDRHTSQNRPYTSNDGALRAEDQRSGASDGRSTHRAGGASRSRENDGNGASYTQHAGKYYLIIMTVLTTIITLHFSINSIQCV